MMPTLQRGINTVFYPKGRHGLAHLLPKRFPSSASEESAKGVPQPTYLAPAIGEDELPQVSDEFYTDEHVIPKCKFRA